MTTSERSGIMRAVKDRDTGPERIVRSLLHKQGFRFRLHRRDLPGKPDIVFSGRRKVIFVHGCFWHGHECKRGARTPKTNTAYWVQKIARNRERDRLNRAALVKRGWQILTIWECETGDEEHLKARIMSFLG